MYTFVLLLIALYLIVRSRFCRRRIQPAEVYWHVALRLTGVPTTTSLRSRVMHAGLSNVTQLFQDPASGCGEANSMNEFFKIKKKKKKFYLRLSSAAPCHLPLRIVPVGTEAIVVTRAAASLHPCKLNDLVRRAHAVINLSGPSADTQPDTDKRPPPMDSRRPRNEGAT